MKVAYFCDTYAPQINGVAMTLKRLRQYAEANRIETIFLVPDYPGNREPEENVHRISSLPLLFYRDCRLAVPPVFQAERLLDRFKPDIIHAYSEFTISLSAIRYARKRNIPIVSSYTTNFTAYLRYYHLDFLTPCLEAYLSWFHNRCSLTFCPSQQTQDDLSRKNIRHTGIMRRGVDFSRFSPAFRASSFREAAGARDGSVVFTYVGRISPEKDLDILAESIRRIKRKYGEKAIFVMVGDGPERKCFQSELDGLAFFTGFLKGPQLSEAYASSDVFVFPSTSETFGNVVLEAMSSGLPAVVPDAGGVAELIADKSSGFVVPPRDAEAFTAAVEHFLQFPEVIAPMGKNALQSSRGWSWEAVFGELFEQYRDIVREEPQKRPGIGPDFDKGKECTA